MGRHGGGAFSGKDPSKVDRSACYYARYIAKNVVASGVAKRCEVQIAYAIGVAQPVGVHVNTFGTGKVDDEVLEKYILANFDMRPKALIEELDLLRPIYKPTAAYGHFGRSEFPWEKTTAPPRSPTTSVASSAAGAKRHGTDGAQRARLRRSRRARKEAALRPVDRSRPSPPPRDRDASAPPYSAVIFTSLRTPDDETGYAQTAG